MTSCFRGGAATSTISKIDDNSARGSPHDGKGAAPESKIVEHDSKMDDVCQQESGTSATGAAPICQRAAPTNKMGDSCREGGSYK